MQKHTEATRMGVLTALTNHPRASLRELVALTGLSSTSVVRAQLLILAAEGRVVVNHAKGASRRSAVVDAAESERQALRTIATAARAYRQAILEQNGMVNAERALFAALDDDDRRMAP